MFSEGVKNNWIKLYNLNGFFIYTSKLSILLPTLANQQINMNVERDFGKTVSYNPKFWFQRFLYGKKISEFFWDVYNFFKFLYLSATRSPKPGIYFSEMDWPKYYFYSNLPLLAFYQKVGAKKIYSIKILTSCLTNKDNMVEKKRRKAS